MPSALGIPDREDYGTHTDLKPGMLVPFVDQGHQADRAGFHHDIRLGDAKGGLLSWAVRKGLPAETGKHLAVQQPIHSGDYASFAGEIPEGYGKGSVENLHNGEALITNVDKEGISFTTASEKYPRRFRLQMTSQGWLLINTTDTKTRDYVKEKMKVLPQERAGETFSPENVVQAKLDGAAIFIENLKHKLEGLSYRNSTVTGGPILHSEKMGLYNEKPFAPPGTVLRGELYGTQEGKAIHPSELGGLLNSSISKSVNKQQDQHIQLKVALYDILQHGKRPVGDQPYEQRLALLKSLTLPKNMSVMEGETDPKKQAALWKQIQSGKHPLTSEGIVSHPLKTAGPATKVPITAEHDVIIKEITPTMGIRGNPGVSVSYAMSDNPDKIVGNVGSGFTDADMEDMLDNPDQWLGRKARLHAKEQLKSGALRAPVFLARHEG